MDGTAGIDPSTAVAVLAGAPDATIVIDHGGTIRYANQQVMDLFGWPPDELRGQQLEVLVPESLRARHVRDREEFSAAPHARPMGVGLDLAGLRRDGTEVPVEISLSPIETPDGVLVAASIRDISERLAAAAALRAERDHVTAVIEALRDGMLEYDAGADQYVRVNRTFCELVGRSPDEVLSASHPPPWWPEDERERNEASRMRMFEGVASRVELMMQHADGRRFPVAVTTSVIPGDAARGRFIMMYHDLTDERRVAAELSAVEAEMEVADDRDRIARDLHDGVIQRLFAAGLHLQAAVNRPDVRERVVAVIDDLDRAITEIRAAIFTLHRPREVTIGLEHALRVCTAEAARVLGHQPTLTLSGDLHAVPPELVHEATTVVRELFSNVAKHAGASHTWLSVVADGALTIGVDDDGIGIDPDTGSQAGDGLRNLRERARARGGNVVIADRPSRGTHVEWAVPLDEA